MFRSHVQHWLYMALLSGVKDFILLFLSSTGFNFISMLEGENGPLELPVLKIQTNTLKEVVVGVIESVSLTFSTPSENVFRKILGQSRRQVFLGKQINVVVIA